MEFSSAQAMNQSFFKQVMIQDRRDPRSFAQGFNTGGSFDLKYFSLPKGKLCLNVGQCSYRRAVYSLRCLHL